MCGYCGSPQNWSIPPRCDLFAAEVVAFLAGDDQPGFHVQEERKVLALRQQSSERFDHAVVVRVVQRPAQPFLHVLQVQLLVRGLQSAKEERARSAVEAELEGRLVVDHEQAAAWPAAEFLQFRPEAQPRLGRRDTDGAGAARFDHHGPTVRDAADGLHRVLSVHLTGQANRALSHNSCG